MKSKLAGEKRGGRRPGAGRPKQPRITLDLSAELLAVLHGQAAQNNQTPEEHAADLLREALTAPLFRTPAPPQIEQHQVQDYQLRRLGVGEVPPTGAHHLNLWAALREGATLTEIGPNIWSLKTPTGSHQIDRRTVATLLQKGTLFLLPKNP